MGGRDIGSRCWEVAGLLKARHVTPFRSCPSSVQLPDWEVTLFPCCNCCPLSTLLEAAILISRFFIQRSPPARDLSAPIFLHAHWIASWEEGVYRAGPFSVQEHSRHHLGKVRLCFLYWHLCHSELLLGLTPLFTFLPLQLQEVRDICGIRE